MLLEPDEHHEENHEIRKLLKPKQTTNLLEPETSKKHVWKIENLELEVWKLLEPRNCWNLESRNCWKKYVWKKHEKNRSEPESLEETRLEEHRRRNTRRNHGEKFIKEALLPCQNPISRHKTRLHIGQLVKDTSAKLKQASETDQYTEVSASKKVADAKLAKDFQAVLKEFQKAQRLAAERETAYAPFVPKAVIPSSYTASELDTRSDKNWEEHAILVESRRQEVVVLDNEIVFNEAIIEEREQGIQEIQNQIGEVNEIFKDLAVLVHEQGVMIDDIDSNIENSAAATTQAKSQLGKAAKTQKSNSSLMCLLMVIFGIVLLIVIIVLAA